MNISWISGGIPIFLIDGFSFITEPDHRDYTNWKKKAFSTQQLSDTSVSGYLCDPDGDGMINLLEYAFYLEPTKFNKAGKPNHGQRDGYLTMTYRQNKGATNLNFIVESSQGLVGSNCWSGAGLEEVSRTDSNTHWSVTVRDAQPIAEKPQGFLRLKVEVAE